MTAAYHENGIITRPCVDGRITADLERIWDGIGPVRFAGPGDDEAIRNRTWI
jgi:hypothetical protein